MVRGARELLGQDDLLIECIKGAVTGLSTVLHLHTHHHPTSETGRVLFRCPVVALFITLMSGILSVSLPKCQHRYGGAEVFNPSTSTAILVAGRLQREAPSMGF